MSLIARLVAVAATAFLVSLLSAAASAQTAQEDSVQNRARPDFDPIGIELDELLGVAGLVSKKTIEQKSSPLSSFVVHPSFGVTGVYESNIFLTENSQVGDRRVEYKPELVIQSDWGRHSLSLRANGTLGRYVENTNEDFDDYQIQLSGRLDIHDNKKLDVVTGIAQRHEERNEEDDPGQGFEPTVSFNRFVDMTFEYFADAALARYKLNYEYKDYRDADTFDNDFRDETVIKTSLRLGYEFSPGTMIFIEPNADFRIFDQPRDNAGFLQDNFAVGHLAGVTWDVTGVTFLEVGAGFSYRSYEDPSFDSELNFDYSLKAIWNLTDVMTLTADLARRFEDSGTAGESGSLQDSGKLSLDYEFLDHIIISGGAVVSFSTTDQSGREDFNFGPTLGIRYLVNENWAAQLDLGYTTRHSSVVGESYDNYSAGFGLVGKL